MPNHYEVLGVPRDADADTIKKAYRKLAREHHPDATGGDPAAEERFKQIGEAYAVLSDPEKRRRYDLGGDPNAAGFGAGGFGDLNSIFESFFGGAGFGGAAQRQRQHPGDGRDLGVEVRVTLAEAVHGTRTSVTAATRARCPDCLGEGCAPGTYRRTCARCGGAGQLRQQRQTLLGTMVTATTCPACGGAGEGPTDPCRTCRGDGRVTTEDEVEIEVPAGIDDGQTLRISGRGEPGVRGGRDGDLYVTVRVQPHPVFERHGADLACELKLSIPQAVLGTTLEVDTLDGPVELRIPPGTPHGATLRLGGHGASSLRSRGRGDLLIVVSLEVPRALTDEQRAVYEQLAELEGSQPGDPSPSRGFFGRLRDTILGE